MIRFAVLLSLLAPVLAGCPKVLNPWAEARGKMHSGGPISVPAGWPLPTVGLPPGSEAAKVPGMGGQSSVATTMDDGTKVYLLGFSTSTPVADVWKYYDSGLKAAGFLLSMRTPGEWSKYISSDDKTMIVINYGKPFDVWSVHMDVCNEPVGLAASAQPIP